MHALSSIFVLGSCAVQTVLSRPESAPRTKREGVIIKRAVDSFIETETPIAWEKLLCNIGSDGCAASGAASGAVVASPSKEEPDYWYTWTRDSALVLTGIIDSFSQNYSASLQSTIQNYITATAKLQGVSNPSGSLSDGTGLGEAKFNVDLTAFTGDWGRPQRDGPALRAIALTRYSKWLVSNGYADTAKDAVWPVIQNDLAYTAQYWNETGFDLWEEVKGSSFFAVGSAHRALVEGADLAARLDTECRACITVAPQVLCFLQTFWNPDGGFVVSNINGGESRSGKDVDSVLTSIHTFDPSVGCDANTFQPCSDKALSNHKVYVDSFRSVYGINSGIAEGKAVAVGRYSEDVYYNGNPWYLANFAAAEQLYDAIFVWKKDGSIDVTDTSLGFFKDLVPSITTGTYDSSSSTFTSIIDAVSAYADGFIDIVSQYAPSDGALAEQYGRDNGSPLSAADLTWSYAAFLTVADRRAGIVPSGWSAQDGNTVPDTCEGTKVAGTYAQAAEPSFPPSQTPNPAAEPAPAPFPTTCAADDSAVYVQFNGKVVTQLGQTVKVSGSAPELGKWDVKKAVPLSASGYKGDSNPLWSITVPIAGGSEVQYKYIRVESDGTVAWESDPNRKVTVKGTKAEGTGCLAQSVDDTWQ